MAQSQGLGYEICLLPREKALTFADYLNSRGIPAKAAPGASEHWSVYAAREEDVPAAKRELARFIKNPWDSSFSQPSWSRGARAPKRRGMKPRFFQALSWNPLSATSIVEVICIAFFIGEFADEDFMVSMFSLNHAQGAMLPWGAYRLITPAFLHFGIMHIAFNLVMWEALARPIERVLGTGKLVALALVVAAFSNLLQYMALQNGVFGGLSGVVYGVIGYLGVISKRPDAPQALGFPAGLLAVSVVFILFGFFTGGIANFCHLGGLAVGAAIGLVDFRRPRLFG
ncbi:MAG: rhomboid family intramembrane serine protease [Aeromonadales bacterium]|nr:rhomboid family intramembrane serine protease [Aeromonadales bacterium]MDY2891389.1 rhomboid family intramembrane serine protease [Succinivibrio sp.]